MNKEDSVEYYLAAAENRQDFNRTLQSLLDDQWELYGIPFCTTKAVKTTIKAGSAKIDTYSTYWCQAMVRVKQQVSK